MMQAADVSLLCPIFVHQLAAPAALSSTSRLACRTFLRDVLLSCRRYRGDLLQVGRGGWGRLEWLS